MSARRSAVGVRASWRTAAAACRLHRARGVRSAFPPAERVAVLALATQKPATYPGPATRWSLDALVAALPQHRPQPSRRSRLWRLLAEADLKPPRRVSWLTSHAPAVAAKALALCQLSLHALRFSHEGRLVIGADEQTGRPILPRCLPTQPVPLGKPEKRADASSRHGVRAFLASCVVATGRRVGKLGHTRPRADWAAHLAHGVRQLPAMPRYAWVVDNLHTHWRLEVCQLVAPWGAVPLRPQAVHRGAQRRAFRGDPTPKQVCHVTPTHGSWLKQVE